MREEESPDNLQAGRNWSYLSTARCFPAPFMAEESGGGVRFPGERFDENSEVEWICQEEKISERNNWRGFMGKFQFVFLLMSNKQNLSDPTWSK